MKCLRITCALLLSSFLATSAYATLFFDSGINFFSATDTQFGRLVRNGVASTWGSVKPFPGVTGAPNARGYEFFEIDTGDFTMLQVTLDDPTGSFFIAAYLDSFNPVNSAPNYGLDVNYLGDPGNSGMLGSPTFFQIDVAPHTQIVLPINEINPGGGTNQPFQLIVEGFGEIASVPEPGTLALLGMGLAGLGFSRRKQ